jgi:outer membrane immunogenic protein
MLALALSTVVFSAQAADLGAPRMPVAGAVVAPAFNWTGFYLGAQVGHGWARTGYDINIPPAANSGTNFNVNGLFGGIHGGYLWQFNQAVFGIETDIELTGARGNDAGFNGSTDQVDRRWQGSTRLIGGFAVDRALFYATAGAAYGDFKFTQVTFASVSKTAMGWTAGAGIAYAITPNISARLEYRYTGYGAQGFIFPVNVDRTMRAYGDHAIRLGVSYHFTTGPSAVVARY